MAMYNPITNSFTYYTPTETPKASIQLPLMDEPLDISSWATGVSKNGNIITSSPTQEQSTNENTFKAYKPEITREFNLSSSSNNDISSINNTSTTNNKYQSMNNNINDAQRKAFNYFKNKVDENGNQILQDYQIAGLVGNLMQESSLNHTIVNKNSGAYGLAQWLGSRKEALYRKYGKNPTFDQQLDFIWEELNTTERSAFNHLLQTRDYKEATNSVMNKFERPSAREKAESIQKRLNNAKSLLS